MTQLWILRADQHPVEALHSGADQSVCGTCPLRPAVGGACYVNPLGPLSVWKAWKAGQYDAAMMPATIGSVRLGAYGDPSAIPLQTLCNLIDRAEHWTGYTHQWRVIDPIWRFILMASVETDNDRLQAVAKGYRTFRLTSAPSAGEIVCPASDEAGKRTTCAQCKLCNGSRADDVRRSITIRPHGFRVKG
jgi:hypothetical protein